MRTVPLGDGNVAHYERSGKRRYRYEIRDAAGRYLIEDASFLSNANSTTRLQDQVILAARGALLARTPGPAREPGKPDPRAPSLPPPDAGPSAWRDGYEHGWRDAMARVQEAAVQPCPINK